MKTRTRFSWDGSRGSTRSNNKFFVLQARRLLPLAFLLVLLVGLAVWGNFFDLGRDVDVTTNYGENSINYTTAATGDLVGNPQFWLAETAEQWDGIKEELALELPDYPFNPNEEIGIFSLNGEVSSIETLPRQDDMLVQVTVTPRSRYYHVITVPRQDVEAEGLPVTWVFADDSGNVFQQVANESSDAAAEGESGGEEGGAENDQNQEGEGTQ